MIVALVVAVPLALQLRRTIANLSGSSYRIGQLPVATLDLRSAATNWLRARPPARPAGPLAR